MNAILPDIQERLVMGPFELVHQFETDAADPIRRDVWVLPGTGSLRSDQQASDPQRRRELAKANFYTATTQWLMDVADVNGWKRPYRITRVRVTR